MSGKELALRRRAPLSGLVLATALALAPLSSARAAEPGSKSSDRAPPPAAPSLDAGSLAPARGDDASVPGPEALRGATRVRVRPARVRPGDLFEISVHGEHLRAATGSFAGRSVSLYAAGASSFRGYAAVPLDFPAGPAPVRVAVIDEQNLGRSLSATMHIAGRAVVKKAITVGRRFTSPSAAQIAQMKADAKAIAKSYQVRFGPPLFQGNFAEPLGGERGSRFGEKRVFNGRTKSRHWGLDIDGSLGEPVRAANGGLVTLARPCFTSGWTVLVSHGAGLFTGYFHLSKFAVRAGQAVKQGQVLGYVGSTGRSTGPHLHFAAKLHHALFDPETLLAFDFASALRSAEATAASPVRPDAGAAEAASAASP